MSERKLATIRRIDKIEPIEGADKIVKATVGGWQLVTAIDNGFKEGDLVVYCEIDSWLPHELAPFLSKGKEPREFNGVKGERIRTIKLRGQISQGLILPYDTVWDKQFDFNRFREGDDVTEYLGIQKWEKPIPTQLQGVCRSTFPLGWCPKTDQERVQNLQKELREWIAAGVEFEITEKLEGSSMTVLGVMYEDHEYGQQIVDVHVASRNMDLKLDQEGNAFVDTAKRTGLIDAITRYVGLGYGEIAVQGELIGPGIQGNIYNLKETQFFLFDVFDIKTQEYMTPDDRKDAFALLKGLGANIFHVPVLDPIIKLFDDNIPEILEYAEGSSLLNRLQEREGIVYKSVDGKHSFKAISNKFLLNGGE